MKQIYITISEQQYRIKQSFRALMLFEEMTSKSVGEMNESVADVLKLFYCILKGNNMQTFTYTFEEYLDIMDEQPEAFTEFTEYLQEQATGTQPEQKKSLTQ